MCYSGRKFLPHLRGVVQFSRNLASPYPAEMTRLGSPTITRINPLVCPDADPKQRVQQLHAKIW